MLRSSVHFEILQLNIFCFVFAAKVPPSRSKGNSSGKLIFHFKLDQNTLTSWVPSAFLWLHMRKSNRHKLNGKFLHIEALYKKSEKERTDIPGIRVIRSRMKKEKKSGSGWIIVDIKDVVKHWFNKTALQYNATDRAVRTLKISCKDCESDISRLISSRGRLRPFLVIDLQKPKSPNRKKRGMEHKCTENQVDCCWRSLYINFTKIGWDWILMPKGFDARFCSGRCSNDRLSNYGAVLRKFISKNPQRSISPPMCCTPTKMSTLSMLYFDADDSEQIVKKDAPNMKVESCGCS